MSVILGNRFRKWVDPATGREGLSYWCEGCNMLHGMCTKHPAGPEHAWRWNGDPINCVFEPSQNTTWDDQSVTPPKRHVCHTFIGMGGAQPGQVTFLGDCTHALVGQTRPLPELPEWLRN